MDDFPYSWCSQVPDEDFWPNLHDSSLPTDLFFDRQDDNSMDPCYNGPPHHRPPSLPSASYAHTPSAPRQERVNGLLSGNLLTSHSTTSSLHQRPPTPPPNPKRSHLDPPNFPLQSELHPTAFTPYDCLNRAHRRPTPPSRPINNTTSADLQPSSPLSQGTLFPSDASITSGTSWPETDDSAGFVDLTQDSTPPAMPSPRQSSQRRGKRRISLSQSTGTPSMTPANLAKRRKIEVSSPSEDSKPVEIEEIDLRDVDDDDGLTRLLEQQRMATIKAQQEQASRPVKLATLQCIICMENMKDMTATHCGHLFCHTCLMEALIAGESQGFEPGKGTPKCPVCRKKCLRAKVRKDSRDLVPLSIKVKKRSDAGKGKARAY